MEFKCIIPCVALNSSTYINRITVEFKFYQILPAILELWILIESQWNLNQGAISKTVHLLNINRITVEFKLRGIALPYAIKRNINRITVEFKLHKSYTCM